jgi:fructose-1,6-bisphosphatase/inositol monophosphatase family enzyme
MYAAAGSVVTEEMLDVAQQLADAAAAVTTPLFRQKLPIDIKDDKSPVTEADREAEASMRSIIQERLPTHAVFGEEQGFSQGAGEPLHSPLPMARSLVHHRIDGSRPHKR